MANAFDALSFENSAFEIVNAGTMAVTETADTLAASGKENFTGTSAVTETADSLAAAGKENFTGTSAVTEDADSFAGSGKENFTGTMSVTETADGFSGVGLETYTGTSGITEGADTMVAAGQGGSIYGTGGFVEANDNMEASDTEQGKMPIRRNRGKAKKIDWLELERQQELAEQRAKQIANDNLQRYFDEQALIELELFQRDEEDAIMLLLLAS